MIASFKENELTINTTKIHFLHPIDNILVLENGVVVLLRALAQVSDKNIYFVNHDGSIKWRIQNLEPEKDISHQYYSNIGLNDEGILVVTDFGRSSTFKVNIEDGTLYDQEFYK